MPTDVDDFGEENRLWLRRDFHISRVASTVEELEDWLRRIGMTPSEFIETPYFERHRDRVKILRKLERRHS